MHLQRGREVRREAAVASLGAMTRQAGMRVGRVEQLSGLSPSSLSLSLSPLAASNAHDTVPKKSEPT